jgi:outer membrane receptor protein involved in Fe transport
LNVRFGTDVLFDRVSYKLDQLYSSQLRSVGAPNAEQAFRQGVRHLGLIGEYAEAEFRWGPFRLTPGLRLEQMHWTGHTYFLAEPRIWARASLDAATALHGYAGIYHEHPTAQALDSLLGNPALTPERAEQYGLGITRKFGNLWTVRLEGYYNRRSSLVFPAEARARGDGTFDNPLQLNSGVGHSIGLEVLIRRELSARLYGWIAYTLSRSRERTAPGKEWTPTPYDQPHVLTALVGWRPSPQVEFSARLRVASGNPYAPVLGSTFDADSGLYVPSRLAFGTERLPPFVQLDFQINNIWSADTYQIALYVEFQNLLNRRNSEYLVYDYRFARNEAVHGLPFLGAVGIKVSF